MHKTKTTTLTTLLILGLIVTTIPAFITTSTAANGDWTLIYDGRGVKAYPDLKEYVWQKNATMEPHGIYDKIGLHRLVKTGITPKGVVFLCTGFWYSAEQVMSNPPGDNWTKNENHSQPMYWANRGFDVYGIDYRTHFVPIALNSSQLSFMANWGFDQWISDIKEAVDKAKEVSGATKIFMAGFAGGGPITMNYASKYWQQDLRGIILIDGRNASKNTSPKDTYNLTATLAQMNAGGTWGVEYSSPPSGAIFLLKYALESPGGPAVNPVTGASLIPAVNPSTNKTWTNITEYMKFLTGSRTSQSNIPGGYGTYDASLLFTATVDRYWPNRLNLEIAACGDWTNCPYVTYDYDDHYGDINVPLLGFISELYGLPLYGPVIKGIANPDVTGIVLAKYGHFDSFIGVYSARDVSQPVLDWMGSQLVGLKASAFCNVTVLSGWTWYFFAHSIGGIGTHAYQWYEGTTLLQGQTSMVLPVTKNTPGTYKFYCKVTDSEGATTNSNAVTLTVIR